MHKEEFPLMHGRTVLQIIPDLNEGGAERTTIEVAEAIVEAGGNALVASQGGTLEDVLREVGGQLIRLPLSTKNLINLRSNARRIEKIISSNKVDLVHARSRAPAWSARWATRSNRTKFVTTYHGAYSSNNFLKTKYNSVMASGDRVIANSKWIADHIIQVHKIELSRLVVIPRGVDLDIFDPSNIIDDRIQLIKKAWKVDFQREDVTIILLPGRFSSWKGHLFAIDALTELPKEILNKIVLVFAGDHQRKQRYARKIKEKISKFGLENHVRFGGHTKDMPAAYLSSDIVLTPSIRPEAFGRTAAEAGAMGRPVIACDHGGAREVIQANISGLTVSPNDRVELSNAICSLLKAGVNGRNAMGAAARDRVKLHFSKRSLQGATLNVYDDLLRSKV